ncbi:MAG: hypothetical protein ACT4PK_09785 [Gammaproteobacteria bacterium]
MTARHRRRTARVAAVTLAAAMTLTGVASDGGMLASLRQALRLTTSLIRVPAPPPAPAPTITTGVRG